jgi:hypothetical protein
MTSATASTPVLSSTQTTSGNAQAFVEEPALMASSQSLPDLISTAPDMHTQYEMAANTTLEMDHSSSAKPSRSLSTTTRRWFTKDKPITSPTSSEPSISISSSPLRQSSLMSYAGSFLTRRKVSPTALGNDIQEPAPAQQQTNTSSKSTNGIAIPNRRGSILEREELLSTTPDSLHSTTSSLPISSYSEIFRSESESEKDSTVFDSESHGIFSSSLSLSLDSPTLSVADSKSEKIDRLQLSSSASTTSSTTTTRLRSKSLASCAVSEISVNAPSVAGELGLDALLREAKQRSPGGQQLTKVDSGEEKSPTLSTELKESAIEA